MVAPKSLQVILRRLIDELRDDYLVATKEGSPYIPATGGQLLSIPQDMAHWSVLPSFWFWFPTGIQRMGGREALRQVRDSMKYFPHVGVTGRSRWVDFALGGAMMQVVNFRLFVIVAAPPAVDIVERLTNTISFFSFCILNKYAVADFWWFTTVTEVEPVYRSGFFPQWTIGTISGEIRCHPQVLPILNPQGEGSP